MNHACNGMQAAIELSHHCQIVVDYFSFSSFLMRLFTVCYRSLRTKSTAATEIAINTSAAYRIPPRMEKLWKVGNHGDH